MDTDNGGWIVIQRRIANGTVDFYQKWNDYERGFGDLDGEFWMGLQNIHYLTTRDEVELRIDLQDEEGNKASWTYQQFVVDGPATNYRLRIGQGEGVGGIDDSMAIHNNNSFSTYDRNNDAWSSNCAQLFRGAWWYGACLRSNLNGPHDPITPPPPPAPQANRVIWADDGRYIYYPNVEMKVRAKTCQLREECDNHT